MNVGEMAIRVEIDYTNWRGERNIRKIQPIEISFGSNKWHHEPQWLLTAIDLADKSYPEKSFALKNIHSWKPI